MINQATLEKKLEQWKNSPAGKKRIEKYLEDRRKSGLPLANGKHVVGQKEMIEMANALIAIIKERLPDSIASVGDSLKYTSPIKQADGGYKVMVQFDKTALHRDSLENDRGYDGIDNIVALFNNGYHAKNYAYGWWKGHKSLSRSGEFHDSADDEYAWVRSQKEREALHFMQDAEAAFNSLYGAKYNVMVELGSDYVNE